MNALVLKSCSRVGFRHQMQWLAARRLFEINDSAQDFIFTAFWSPFWIYLLESMVKQILRPRDHLDDGKRDASEQPKSDSTTKVNFTNHMKARGVSFAWLLELLVSWADSCEVVAWADWTWAHLWHNERADWTGSEERPAPTEQWAPTTAVTRPQGGGLTKRQKDRKGDKKQKQKRQKTKAPSEHWAVSTHHSCHSTQRG